MQSGSRAKRSSTDSRRSLPNRALLFVFMLLLVLTSCRSHVQHRPWGYLRLGPVQDFLKSETYLPDERLLVRMDSRGLSVMSTACTYDLTALVRRSAGNGEIWASEETSSTYTDVGKVLTGPARADLPYYELTIDEGEVDGPKDTLYAKVGAEVTLEWRLPLPNLQ